jgi:hypothetical protein
LALLLALPASAAEQGGFGGAEGIDFNAAKAISGRAPANAGVGVAGAAGDRSARIRQAHAALQASNVPVYRVIEVGDRKMGWTVDNMADFGGVIEAAQAATRSLHATNPDAVADTYRGHCLYAGTLTNLNQSLRGRLERGCLAHQAAVFGPARAAAGPSLTVSGIRYGLFPQHNAVIVFPNGTDWRYTGIVLDGWKCQSSELPKMVYLYENWGGARPVELFGREWEINPNPGSAMPRLVSVP